MQLKLTSISSVAQSFIVVAACVAAPLFCASRASADISGFVTAWGINWYGQCTIPASAKSGVSAIAGGYGHTIALKGGTDCDNNSFSDTVEITQDPTLDRNLSGTLDSCDIRDNPALDRNVNGIPDSYEIAQNPLLDRNGNGVLDTYEILQNPGIDSNQNGVPDSVDIAAANAQVTALTAQLNCGDLNGDGEVNGADVGLQLMNYGPCAPPEVAPQIKGTRKESPR